MIDNLLPSEDWILSRWSWDQLESVNREIETKMDTCFKICMASHYSSGKYIDANAKWERLLSAHDKIRRYVYSSLPYWVYDHLYGKRP